MADKPTTVSTLPIWKKDAPTHERLYELAEFAREHPEYFEKWLIVYCEDNEQRFKTRVIAGESMRTSDCLAILTAAIQQLWENTRR